eukprot:scaffold346_cov116-Cylindrotheca_fusiformis.AAC.13
MLDVTNFLMRWLFLCNLIRDVAEIQTLPYNPYTHLQHPEQAVAAPASCEDEWRGNCLRGILSYPPGSQRLLVIDSMRAELVKRLSNSLTEADQILERYKRTQQNSNNPGQPQNRRSDDLYLDADTDILNAFSKETNLPASKLDGSNTTKTEDEEAVLVVADRTVDVRQDIPAARRSVPSAPDIVEDGGQASLSVDEVGDAQQTIRIVRDYLPQLVSVVLKSPPPFEGRLLDPVDKLRRMIIKRCIDDANWGVDMCWLLEAEVGRTWKKLFEHRQQTGRRLIVVLPAEKAAVLAKIGTEKREAFDLLQDAEQATAYGYTVAIDGDNSYRKSHHDYPNDEHVHPPEDSTRLPSSLSLRRCSHFGDTMHFIDRLTKISLELRQVPTVHRHVSFDGRMKLDEFNCGTNPQLFVIKAYLTESLREMNRRLRRRMITRGDVSLDVEDNRSPDDWPLLSDISSDFLRYSVHLPLDPKQSIRWPGGDESEDVVAGGAVRVLNIVVDECRTLASRERCPFLVHVEVAETGLSGNDSRLFASGAPGLGATVEEALSLTVRESSPSKHVHTPYQIPAEILDQTSEEYQLGDSLESMDERVVEHAQTSDYLRGGWESNETNYYTSHGDPYDVLSSAPYDQLRQKQYEQLHHQMYYDQMTMTAPVTGNVQGNPMLSTREALLSQVFGQAWQEKCEEIRQASPFGKTEGWRLASFIMKAGEDIRREAFVMQIIVKLNEWFQADIPEDLRPHLRPYTIMCVGGDAGLVECLKDAKSIDEVKKKTDGFQSLRDFFERAYGPPTSFRGQDRSAQAGPTSKEATKGMLTFEEAQDNFLRSLVGYSLVCYILQIKDRHNANILLDRQGNIIHIDFGFVLGDRPKMGKVPIFSEPAPFKLSTEFWDVLGGWNVNQGGLGVRFCHMLESAFASASKHAEEIVSLVEATMLTLTQRPQQARMLANGVRTRLRMRGPPGSKEQKAFIMELVNAAHTSWGASTYDWLQRNMNGYQ